jgi:hypothetical protein
MFRTFYVYHQEDYIVPADLYGIFFMHLCKPSSRLEDVLKLFTYMHEKHISLYVQYSLPDDEHKMIETCRRQDELN